ncbi:MAG: DUF4062 domain-containing protein, partial [Candidatus Hodarchaeota archaeon]
MAQTSKTFRIFVSSTFSDLKEERNALQRNVFPKLRELCLQHGCRFQAIDLRWGVREEAAQDQLTLRICMEEIARCQRVTPRPNFIILLGDRYGWCPLPYEISAEEFEQILLKISDKGSRELLTYWYRRDNNAVPPVYDLQPRIGEFTDSAKWEPIERHLRSILLKAIKALSLEVGERLKYISSATEQEIVQGALDVQDASRHVFCFFRSIRIPQKDGSLLPIKDTHLDYSFRDFVDLDQDGNFNHKVYAQLNNLKERLIHLLPGHIYRYEATWTAKGLTTHHLDRLCEDVYNSLSQIILEEISQLEEIDALDREIMAHEVFGKERSRFFIGRVTILQSIADYINGNDSHPLTIFGASGSGKTALMAQALKEALKNHPNTEIIFRFIGATPDSLDGLTLLKSLCHQIYQIFRFDQQKQQKLAAIKGKNEDTQQRQRDIEEEYSIPMDFQKLSITFREFIKKISLLKKKLILFIDGLNQLYDKEQARNLSWLPGELPENVRLIVSTLPCEYLSILENKLPEESLLELKSMSLNEGSILLDLWLKDASRTLQDHQQKEVLNKFSIYGMPLYLKLAFEESKRWKSYTEKTELSLDTPGIIGDLFNRLSSEVSHGKIMVSHALGYLIASKNGLTEDELLDVLSLDEKVLEDFIQCAYYEPPEKKLPVVVWSRLYFDLKPYLIERSVDGLSLLCLYHQQFAEVTSQHFLMGKNKRERHRSLARYFKSQELFFYKDSEQVPNLRKLTEQPFQEIYGELWNEIDETLCNLIFIESKVRSGKVIELLEDYDLALIKLKHQDIEDCNLVIKEQHQEFSKNMSICCKVWTKISSEYDVLNQKRSRNFLKRLFFRRSSLQDGRITEIVNSIHSAWPNLPQFPSSIRPESSSNLEIDSIKSYSDFDIRIRSYYFFVRTELLFLDAFGTVPGFTIGHAYNLYNSGHIGSSAAQLVYPEKNSKVIHLALTKDKAYKKSKYSFIITTSKSRSFYHPNPFFTARFQGNTDKGIALNIDGSYILSAGRPVRLWDTRSGQFFDFAESAPFASCCSLIGDGSLAVTGHEDGTIRIWDSHSGECLRLIKASCKKFRRNSPINAISVTPDGRIAVSGCRDRWIKAWELPTGRCLYIFKRQKGPIRSLSISVDGQRAVSSSGKFLPLTKDYFIKIKIDPTIKVWNLNSGTCEYNLKGYTKYSFPPVAAISGNGKRAISGGDYDILKIWNLETGSCIYNIEISDDKIFAVDLSYDGKLGATACLSGLIHIWDLESGERLAIIDQKNGLPANSIKFFPDGSRLVSIHDDGNIYIWDIMQAIQWSNVYQKRGHKREISALAIGCRDNIIATVSPYDKKVKVWDIITESCKYEINTQKSSNFSICIDPCIQDIIVGGDNEISQIDTNKGMCKRIWDWGPKSRDISHLVMTPDGGCFVAAIGDIIPQQLAYNSESPDYIYPIFLFKKVGKDKWYRSRVHLSDRIIKTMALSPCGRFLAWGDSGGKIIVVDLANRNEISSIKDLFLDVFMTLIEDYMSLGKITFKR